MKIKEILKESIKIYAARPMSCPSCNGTGKDQFDPKKNCQDCQGIGSFEEPHLKTIDDTQKIIISELQADVFLPLVGITIDTVKDGYIGPKDFAKIRKRILKLKNTNLGQYASSEETEPERREVIVDPVTKLDTIKRIPSKIITPAVTEEDIRTFLVKFEPIVVAAHENNLTIFLDDSDRPF